MPTHIDLCDADEVKTKCNDILTRVNKQRQEIRKTIVDQDVRGSSGDCMSSNGGYGSDGARTPDIEKKALLNGQQQVEEEMPHLPTHYKISEDGAVKVAWFHFVCLAVFVL